jgi:acetylcholinesterase
MGRKQRRRSVPLRCALRLLKSFAWVRVLTARTQAISLAWAPREDGVFLTDNPQQLVAQGSVAPVPFVTGDCDDEGTILSLFNANLTTDDEVAAYLEQYYLPQANFNASVAPGNATSARALVAAILAAYPADPTQGSPFDTGTANALTPQYKRIAAILGDLSFQAPRRFFQQSRAGKQAQFAFLNKRGKNTPAFGAAHGSDIAIIYGPADMTDYLIRFGVTLDPNGGNTNAAQIAWPAYTPDAPTLLTFLDGSTPLTLSNDTYREEAIRTLIQASLADPQPGL